MTMHGLPDPMEIGVSKILDEAEIKWRRDDARSGLDFFLIDYNVYVEVKLYHTARIAEQMSRKPNVIVVQGKGSLIALAKILGKNK